MNPEVIIEGVPETVHSLDDVASHADAVAAGYRDAERIVLVAARGRAPKRTGRLAASGHSEGTSGSAAVVFGSGNVPYANPIHWGWRAHHIKAQPFLLRAVEQTEPLWLRAYEARLAELIAKETR